MDTYDFVAIGTGVGNSVLNTALNLGLKCAIVEEGKFGGTCLTRGCIPSKILIYPADMIREAQHAKKIGLNFSLKEYDWGLISNRMWSKIDQSKYIEEGLSQVPTLKVFKGRGEFVGEYEMKV